MKTLLAALCLAVLASCAAQPKISPAVRSELAPTGVLRAAVNYGNPSIAQRPAGGEPRGVGPDLARELARRLGVPIRYVSYESAGKVADDAQKNVWDVAFLAIDPKRADTMAFTDGYVEIGGAYLVWRDSPMRENEDLDRKGVRIATSGNSGYDLFLTRELKNAELVRVPDPPQAVQLFLTQKLDAVAAVRELLTRTASENPSVRVLDKNFMVIRQAVVVPKGRDAASAYMTQFVEELKASGFVADSVKRSGSTDATVAPPMK